ncbi:putative peptide maturation dehydrogenase [Lysobacter sp. 2RAF19]
MRARRCGVLWLEPRNVALFEFDDLLRGGTGVVRALQWFAHAPHLPQPVEIDADFAQVVGGIGSEKWVEIAELIGAHGAGVVDVLIAKGLVVTDDPRDAAHREGDARFREQHWHGLSAVSHAASRWSGIDTVQEIADAGVDTASGLRAAYGPPPPTFHDRGPPEARIALARAAPTAFDELLDLRSTCRNFDTTRALPQAQFANVLERVFGARGQVQATDDFSVIKRTSPSGGAMHPTEAYLIVQNVEGIAPGLYHYRPGDHALQPLPPVEDLAQLASHAVGGQQWFADAHVLVVLAPRFERNFWKYRNHPKAYRVTILDVGHLSQTLFLSAIELGLGACITAAINEVQIEEAFGLVHYIEGPLAVCGFGLRAEAMTTAELDPNRKAWPRESPPAE